jgi:hypothetical protein
MRKDLEISNGETNGNDNNDYVICFVLFCSSVGCLEDVMKPSNGQFDTIRGEAGVRACVRAGMTSV